MKQTLHIEVENALQIFDSRLGEGKLHLNRVAVKFIRTDSITTNLIGRVLVVNTDAEAGIAPGLTLIYS